MLFIQTNVFLFYSLEIYRILTDDMECMNTKPATVNIQEPLFSFGVISDIQYGNFPNGMNFEKTMHRYYSDAINKLDDAIKFWNTSISPEFVLQLGDVIDGKNTHFNDSETAFKSIRDSFDKLKTNLHNVLGNHELYNFSRKTLLDSGFYKTDTCDEAVYYDFTVASRFRFVIIDCFEISAIGYDKQGANYGKAVEILKRENPNTDWNDSGNMSGLAVRYVKYNGSVSDRQLLWLEEVLNDADQKEQIVIISGTISFLQPVNGLS